MNKLFCAWFSGFVDGEGCFHVSVVQRKNKWKSAQVNVIFSIGQTEKKVMEFLCKKLDFRVYNKFRKRKKLSLRISREFPECRSYVLCTRSLKDCVTVMKIIDSYPLKTKKKICYDLWKKVVLLKLRKNKISQKNHWKMSELKLIKSIQIKMRKNKTKGRKPL